MMNLDYYEMWKDSEKTINQLRQEKEQLKAELTEAESAVADLMTEYDKLKSERDRLREALQWLVDLKAVEDREGKTPEYKERQPQAWALAKEALKQD